MKNLDIYQLYEKLSEEEKQIWETTHRFVEKEFLPQITHHHREETFPIELIPKLGEMGFLGPQIPEEYGGQNLGSRAYGLIMQELERGDSGLRSFASVQGALVMYPIWRYGSEEQKKKWLPLLASGQKIGCFGLTEPDHGSNPNGMTTRAQKSEHGYTLNGNKMWITNGSIADIAVIWAKLDGEIRGFLVEKGTPGFKATTMKGKFSLRASITSELNLSECVVSSENILPNLPEGQGLKAPLSCLSQARYGIAWGAIGSALATFHCALEYAQNRIQFGKPIAQHQIIQARLAEMASDITHAQLMAFQLAELKDKKVHPTQVSLAKRNNVKMAIETARSARTILGGNGIMDEYPIMRHLMNLETVLTYEGTHDIHTLILGQHITGLNAFS